MLVLGAIYGILGLYFASFGVFHINALFCILGGASHVVFVALTFKDIQHYNIRHEDQRDLIDFQELEEVSPAPTPKPSVLVYVCGVISLIGSVYLFVALGQWFYEILQQNPGVIRLTFPVVLIIFTLTAACLSIYYIFKRLFFYKNKQVTP